MVETMTNIRLHGIAHTMQNPPACGKREKRLNSIDEEDNSITYTCIM